MSKSSMDYSEIAGLDVALARLACKQDKTETDSIVIYWLTQRLQELRAL